jgi:hypothetical protein
MYRLILLAVFTVATAVWAQDPADDETQATEPVETEANPLAGLSEEELEDLDIDSQEDHTEDDEDVFKPTDAVSYQQSVQFPVDI